MSLENYSIEALKDEIKRREIVKNNKPELRTDISKYEFFSTLEPMAKEVVHSIDVNGYYADDTPQYMFEAVMEIFYGKDYFKWHNTSLQ